MTHPKPNSKIPRVRLVGASIQVRGLSITFQRTLRIPDDDHLYPLPPGLGAFPVRRVKDFARRVPASWRERGGFFISMYQREALWMSFAGAHWRPNAVKVGVGGVNAISGREWDERVRRGPQDYVVVPSQPWLDGINAGHNVIRQFVAMPLGQGFTVEGQLTGEEREGGIQFTVVQPKPGLFLDRRPHPRTREGAVHMVCESAPAFAEMGLAAGGRMEQKIYPDPHGRDTWDNDVRTSFHVHIVNSEMYRDITGEPAPPTPISARTYIECGLPWFALYDEHRGDVPAPESLQRVRSISSLEHSELAITGASPP